jgi:hypothetical protein
MNDDGALRDQLLAAEMRRETGEISDADFQEIEADLLARIREIKQRREGGSGPLAFGGAEPLDMSEGRAFQVEASVSGDFHEPAAAPHTTIVETTPSHGALVQTGGERAIEVLDMNRSRRPTRTKRSTRSRPTSARGKVARRTVTRRDRTAPTPRARAAAAPRAASRARK